MARTVFYTKVFGASAVMHARSGSLKLNADPTYPHLRRSAPFTAPLKTALSAITLAFGPRTECVRSDGHVLEPGGGPLPWMM